MLRIDDNSMNGRAKATSHAVGPLSTRRRSRVRRRRSVLTLSLERLEARTLLAGLDDLSAVPIFEEEKHVAALVLESECISVDLRDASPDFVEALNADGRDDVPDMSICVVDDEAIRITAFDVNLSRLVSVASLDHSFAPQHLLDLINSIDFTDVPVQPFVGNVVIPDPVPAQNFFVTKPAADGTSEITNQNLDAASSGANVIAQPPATAPPPAYFSGVTKLNGARWKASDEKLADADALLEVIEWADGQSAATSGALTATPQSTVEPVASAARSARILETHPVEEFRFRDTAFSQVESWTGEDLSPPLQTVAASELPKPMPPADTGEHRAAGLATVRVEATINRWQNWYLLSGIGLWQVILSGRGRQRKQARENLA